MCRYIVSYDGQRLFKVISDFDAVDGLHANQIAFRLDERYTLQNSSLQYYLRPLFIDSITQLHYIDATRSERITVQYMWQVDK